MSRGRISDETIATDLKNVDDWLLRRYARNLQDARATLARADELAKAAQGVPEPSDQGFCEGCCRRPEVIRDDVKLKDGTLYPRYRLDHDASCWYGRIWRALAAYQKRRGEPDEAGPQS
jgi:hypothetical protein